MIKYIATFYSHFGAARFKNKLTEAGVSARTKPVPRTLSTSCGTCVVYEAEKPLPAYVKLDEIEAVYIIDSDGRYIMTDTLKRKGVEEDD